MTTSRMVQPETIRLELDEGDWLLVKARLTAGDRINGRERMYVRNADGTYPTKADGARIMSVDLLKLSTITTYLVDWSLVGLDGKPLDIRGASVATLEAIVRGLDGDAYEDIYTAIEAHETAVAEARAAQKKTRNGAAGSSPISPSLPATAGAMSGSPSSTPPSTT
jgi:hypothetical protein